MLASTAALRNAYADKYYFDTSFLLLPTAFGIHYDVLDSVHEVFMELFMNITCFLGQDARCIYKIGFAGSSDSSDRARDPGQMHAPKEI